MLERFGYILSSAASGINAAAGAVLGVGLQGMLEKPPTSEEFLRTLRALCPPFDSSHPNLLFCDIANLGPLIALFPQRVGVSIITGSVLMAGGFLVGSSPTFFQSRNNNDDDGTDPQRVNGASSLIEVAASAGKNVLYGIGSALFGNGLQSLVNHVLPPSQQILDALCVAEPITSNSTMLCDVNLLKSIEILLAQPSSTTIVVGGVLLGGMGVASLMYALYQCSADSNNPEEEIPLTSKNTDLVKRQNGDDEVDMSLGAVQPISTLVTEKI
jgi:hypothetical protein